MRNENKAKGGRPTLPEYSRKHKSINVRLSTMEYSYVFGEAKQCGLRVAEYARRAIIDQKVTKLLTPEEWKAIADIRNIGNNLNQLARQGNIGSNVQSQANLIIEFISSILKRLR